jgi:nitroreductase
VTPGPDTRDRDGKPGGGLAFGTDAPLHEVMRTTRAIRRLRPEPVPGELLEELVRAATWAPSGSNAQAFGWIVVTDRERMLRLAELWGACFELYMGTLARLPVATMSDPQRSRLHAAVAYQRAHFAQIPALLVACYDVRGQWAGLLRALGGGRDGPGGLPLRHLPAALLGLRRASELAAAASVYPGVQNLLLTARALGLGATLTTWHLALERDFKRVLGIPRGVQTFAIVPVGWPLGRLGPVRRRPVSEVIHWQRWEELP